MADKIDSYIEGIRREQERKNTQMNLLQQGVAFLRDKYPDAAISTDTKGAYLDPHSRTNKRWIETKIIRVAFTNGITASVKPTTNGPEQKLSFNWEGITYSSNVKVLDIVEAISKATTV